MPKTIALVGRNNTPGIELFLKEIIDFLQNAGYTVVFEQETAANIALEGLVEGVEAMTPIQIGLSADVAIVLGGDGTMLGIARQLAPFDVPLIGINQGRLGFMTDIPRYNMIPVLSEILAGNYKSERRSMLEGRVLRDGEAIFFGLALNDIVVSRGSGAGLADLRVDVEDHFMYHQRSDGLIISTPTGSTAYSLSAGGPLLHPNLNGIVLVPIAPHSLSNRPIVVPDSSEIMVEIMGGRDISINFDMQTFADLVQYDVISIKRSLHTVTFLHPLGWSYYDTLREKLHWNQSPAVERRRTQL
jgi:NAD+ kinase